VALKKYHQKNHSAPVLMHRGIRIGSVLCEALISLLLQKIEKVNFKNQFLVHLSTVAVLKNSKRSWGQYSIGTLDQYSVCVNKSWK
jgi:hypothetical protein